MFETDTIDIAFLNKELVRMTEQIAYELRSKNRLKGSVAVKLRYSNLDTETRRVKIAYTNLDDVLLKTVKNLFAQLYTRRMLIRLIGVRFTNLIPRNH